MTQVKFRGVIPRAHFPRSFGGISVSLRCIGADGPNGRIASYPTLCRVSLCLLRRICRFSPMSHAKASPRATVSTLSMVARSGGYGWASHWRIARRANGAGAAAKARASVGSICAANSSRSSLSLRNTSAVLLGRLQCVRSWSLAQKCRIWLREPVLQDLGHL